MKNKSEEVNFFTPMELMTNFIEKKKTEVKSKEALKVLEECSQFSTSFILNNTEKDAFIGFVLTTFFSYVESSGQKVNALKVVPLIEQIADATFDEMFNVRRMFENYLETISKNN